MKLFSRRSLLVTMPAVILTPKLLMPIKPAPEILGPKVGTIIFNPNPTRCIGWRCIIQGNPGTWVEVLA